MRGRPEVPALATGVGLRPTITARDVRVEARGKRRERRRDRMTPFTGGPLPW